MHKGNLKQIKTLFERIKLQEAGTTTEFAGVGYLGKVAKFH